MKNLGKHPTQAYGFMPQTAFVQYATVVPTNLIEIHAM